MKGNQDTLRISDMLKACEDIHQIIHNIDYDEFEKSLEKKYSTVKLIEIVGEAANHLSVELKIAHPHIPWKKIISTRNLTIHEYFRVEWDTIWDIATVSIPELHKQLKSLV